MKVLIFGATGLLGNALMREWEGDDVDGVGSRDADIRDASQVQKIIEKSHPAWIVLAAAFTDVDGCESKQGWAFSVNRDGAVNVARAAKNSGANLLFLSSDYVFDGKKMLPYETDDPRNPQSVYGRTKAEAELRLIEILPDCCLVRTSWLFGAGGKCFPDTILKLAASRPTLDVVSDQRGSPTYSIDLARAIVQLCRQNARGIIHVTNTGDCSWFEFAREIVRQSGLPTEVKPISTAQMARPAQRPPYSVLSSASLNRYGIEMPDWKEALQRYLVERENQNGEQP
ncbi:MAG: dTDP-4-dehydrorhamnose reductase [Candidatus Sulfotelmatobacter sp.]